MHIRRRDSLRRGRGEQLRRLASDPALAAGTMTAGRLNRLAPVVGAQRYLEIGIRRGRTIEAVDVGQRVGVDPEPAFDLRRLPDGVQIHAVTSDAYFATASREVFDLILIDGLHEFRQSYRDVLNAAPLLAPQGVMLIDDVVPSSEIAAIPDLERARSAGEAAGAPLRDWMGDVFRTAFVVATEHPQFDVRTVVDDDGRGQMVLWWRRGAGRDVSPAEAGRLAHAATITYATMFGTGIPDELRPSTLEEVVGALTAR